MATTVTQQGEPRLELRGSVARDYADVLTPEVLLALKALAPLDERDQKLGEGLLHVLLATGERHVGELNLDGVSGRQRATRHATNAVLSRVGRRTRHDRPVPRIGIDVSARADFHFVAEVQPRIPQLFDAGRQIRHLKNDPVPSARSLAFATRHWT